MLTREKAEHHSRWRHRLYIMDLCNSELRGANVLEDIFGEHLIIPFEYLRHTSL